MCKLFLRQNNKNVVAAESNEKVSNRTRIGEFTLDKVKFFLREGKKYHQLLKEINPETGKYYTFKEAANYFRVPYSTFRFREAIWHPYDPSTGRGLTPEERAKVLNGKMSFTFATRKSLGEKQYISPKKEDNIRLREIQNMFDETPASNIERRKTLADCMGLEMEEAICQSEERKEWKEKIRKRQGF